MLCKRFSAVEPDVQQIVTRAFENLLTIYLTTIVFVSTFIRGSFSETFMSDSRRCRSFQNVMLGSNLITLTDNQLTERDDAGFHANIHFSWPCWKHLTADAQRRSSFPYVSLGCDPLGLLKCNDVRRAQVKTIQGRCANSFGCHG